MSVTGSSSVQGEDQSGTTPATDPSTQGANPTAGGSNPTMTTFGTSGGGGTGQPGPTSGSGAQTGSGSTPPATGVHLQVNLPPPTATLAQELHKIPLNEQRRHAAQLYTFLVQPSVDLSNLNNPSNPATTCMVNIPDSSMIRIVHSIGYGTNPIGQVSPIANHILTLTGDGSTANPPQALILPQETATPIDIRVPSEAEFNTKILTNTQFALFKNNDVNARAKVPKLMPIITFLVYDGFDMDLDAVTIYKRVQNLHNQQDPHVQAMLHFLRGCMTKRYKTNKDPTTFVDASYFLANPHPTAREWALRKFHESFPALTQNNPQAASITSQQPSFQLIQSLLQALNPQAATATASTLQTQGPVAPKYEELLGMCQEEIDLHLNLCGLQTGAEASLPQYLTRLAGKNVSDAIKDQIVTSQIRNNQYYDGHRVPITSALLKTIKKRHYIAKDPDLTLSTAQKGLTLISIGLYDEDKIQTINELHEYFDGATFTSPDDMKKLTKITAKLPDTTEKFIEQVKIFANVLAALFTNACPLFIHIKEIVKALMEYKPAARDLIGQKQRASIAWIITLQTKHFFRGEKDTLAEFIMMKNNIRARSPLIYHIEVPTALYQDDTKGSTGKRKVDETNIIDGGTEPAAPKPPKKTKVQLHELFVKHFAKGVWAFNPKIKFREMCTYCNIPIASLHNDPSTCFLGMFNRCSYGAKCNKIHRMATTKEATHIVNLLDKAIKNPEQIVHNSTPGEKGN